jgi:hypothetical protein
MLLLGGLAAPVAADSADRPFAGSVSGQVMFVPTVPPEACPFGLTTTAEDVPGRAMHLGRVLMSSAHCAAFGPLGPGMMTMVAANGDQIDIEYTGEGPLEPAGTFEVHVDGTIVGGTGRFEDATGYLDMTAYIEFQGLGDMSWPATWVWTGRIGY